jgi:hypothetical protein
VEVKSIVERESIDDCTDETCLFQMGFWKGDHLKFLKMRIGNTSQHILFIWESPLPFHASNKKEKKTTE